MGDLNQTWLQGYEDYCNWEDANPHPVGTPERSEWQKGNDEARLENERDARTYADE